MAKNKKIKLYPKDVADHFGLKYLFHNEIKDPKIHSWDLHKDSEYTINPTLNEQLAARYGKQIEQGYHAPVYIKWVNKMIEYGAYADAPIKKGDMICEYTGIVERDDPFDEENLYLWDYPTIMYELKPGALRRNKVRYCVNAEKCGNIARFINHSLKKYQNVGIQIVPYNNQWHVIYVAKKDIAKDEQLITNYGLEYWKDRKIVPVIITPDM